ncbi:hypothetical protein [Pseudodesulfovibrio sp.]|uniref:hypothetical protein n=1 Tax=unclassified Pseudodesulfovibrio TaxID=2661612 RepID=UPI003AFFAACF
MARDRIISYINRLEEPGFLFDSENVSTDANEYDEFRAAINFDVRRQLSRISPYALAVVCGDTSTHLSVIKRKMGLSGGGAAVASYGLYTTEYHSKDALGFDENDWDEVIVLEPSTLREVLKLLYEKPQDKEGVAQIIKQFINLSSPTFESSGNELFADDAEKMSVDIFEDEYDPIVTPIFKINEDDLIYRDLYSTGNGELLEDLTGHARYLTQGGRCLDVINVNRKEGEKALGVDLIYYIREFRSIVMVQYKRISSGTYYTNSDGNYQKEIDRMMSSKHLFMIPQKVEQRVEHKYYRLSDCPFFFKICPESTVTTHKFVSGACISLDHWQSLMKSAHCQTRQGNNRLGYDELDGRYLRSKEFINLTKRGMLGGYIADLAALADLIRELKNLEHTVVASIESPKEDYTDT